MLPPFYCEAQRTDNIVGHKLKSVREDIDNWFTIITSTPKSLSHERCNYMISELNIYRIKSSRSIIWFKFRSNIN